MKKFLRHRNRLVLVAALLTAGLVSADVYFNLLLPLKTTTEVSVADQDITVVTDPCGTGGVKNVTHNERCVNYANEFNWVSVSGPTAIHALLQDANENIYAVGALGTPSGTLSFHKISYERADAAKYAEVNIGQDFAYEFAIDDAGNIYFIRAANVLPRTIYKVTPAGNVVNLGAYNVQTLGIAVDHLGNIYTTFENSLVKITSAGAYSTVYTLPDANDDLIGISVIDSQNNVYFQYIRQTSTSGVTHWGIKKVTQAGVVSDYIPLQSVGTNPFSLPIMINRALGELNMVTINYPSSGARYDSLRKYSPLNAALTYEYFLSNIGYGKEFCTTGVLGISHQTRTVDNYGNIVMYQPDQTGLCRMIRLTPEGYATAAPFTSSSPLTSLMLPNGDIIYAHAGVGGVFAAPLGLWDIDSLVADPPSPPPSGEQLLSVYRFYNVQTGTHFYTATTKERDKVLATLPQFVYEGEVYSVLKTPPAGATNTTGVHRFYNTRTGTHFYTPSQKEADKVKATLPQFLYEGVAFYAYTSPDATTVAVHRFYNSRTGAHFYTHSEKEKNKVISTLPQFLYEGISYYGR